MSTPTTSTDATFAADIKDSKTVVVDFWATWCQPCKQIAPILDELAATHADKLKVVKVDIEQAPVAATQAGITSVPTLNIYRDGELVHQIIGAKPKAALMSEVARFLEG